MFNYEAQLVMGLTVDRRPSPGSGSSSSSGRLDTLSLQCDDRGFRTEGRCACAESSQQATRVPVRAGWRAVSAGAKCAPCVRPLRGA
jgi:hypothetical protein